MREIGILVAIYPGVWGLGQLVTGKMADHYRKKRLLFLGMLLQGAALMVLAIPGGFVHYLTACIALGWGTAMVYPTFMAAVAENTHPHDRAGSLGVFRFWRDLGYALGALLTGIIAGAFGSEPGIITVGFLTLISALVIQWRMQNFTGTIASVGHRL